MTTDLQNGNTSICVFSDMKEDSNNEQKLCNYRLEYGIGYDIVDMDSGKSVGTYETLKQACNAIFTRFKPFAGHMSHDPRVSKLAQKNKVWLKKLARFFKRCNDKTA